MFYILCMYIGVGFDGLSGFVGYAYVDVYVICQM